MKNDNLIEHADQSALLNTQQWTPEPWHLDGFLILSNDHNPRNVATVAHDQQGLRRGHERSEANAQRIVTCVNSLAGIQEPEKAIQGAREALALLIADCTQWLKEQGGCDHSVGICACKEIRNLEQATAALKQLGGKL